MDGRRGHTELVLLAVIAGAGPAHGWTIIEQTRLRTDGIIELGEGAVYPVLHKLQRDGLLHSEWKRIDGYRRRLYTLTRKGRAELERRQALWGQLAHGMRSLFDTI